ncbi:MAG: DUF444 family protein [Candidatus Riflebacteria bacterium]|nr:DUF444 family protein [Candidatus Riflebacteria bacterium]
MAQYVDRGKLAQVEHDKRLREYLKKDFNVLIQKQKLVRDGKVKTNFATLDLPTLRFGKPDKESLASGGGGGKGKPQKGGKPQQGQGQKEELVDVSGAQGADDHSDPQYVELDFDEFVRMAQEQLIEELNLPPLNPPRLSGEVLSDENVELDDQDRYGLMVDLDLEATMVESLKRSLRESGRAEYNVDLRHDGWYFTEAPVTERANRAVEVYLLDISGSVSGHNIALIRKFIFILWYYLDKKYRLNARRYIVFQDEAEEVERDAFFSIESKGGTHISAGLSKALGVLHGFHEYDKYLFFFSDGDNSSSDDEAAKGQLEKLFDAFDLICYGRINPCDSPISPFNKLVKEHLERVENLTFSDIKDLDNVSETVKKFLNIMNR